MVMRNRRLSLTLILLALCISLSLMLAMPIHAQAVTYVVNKEWVHIWINTDRSIDIQYNITLTYTSGSPRGIITVGMPKGGFQIQYVQDLSGNDLSYDPISEGDFYGIDVHLKTRPVINQPNTFIVYAVVPEMMYKDEANPGNVGMQFYPTTFDSASRPIGNVRIAITLPEDVKSGEVKHPTGMPFDDVSTDKNNLVVVYWERSNWPADQKLSVGVSFPEKYVSLGPGIWYYVTIAGATATVIAAVVLIIVVLKRLRKAAYEKPRIAVEALGAARGLTAVEAGVVLDLKPVHVLTMILFGLLLKRMVMVTATDPLIKLRRLESPSEEPNPRLWYYEIDYLDALEPDDSLNEMSLARTYLELRDTVDLKLRGFSRADTVNYYRSIVNKAWEQVAQAGTPELKGDAVDKNIEWLLADDRFDERFRIAFPPDVIIYPRPDWWWYWRGPHFPPGPPTTPTEARPIPGQEFANNIVRSLEKATNNMVKNVQEFTNRLIPAQKATASERSVRSRSSCVCACAHCACACACVSCACACAHGGAR